MPPRTRKKSKRAAQAAEPEEGDEAGPESTKAKRKAKKPKVAPPARQPKPRPERCNALGRAVKFRAYMSAEECKKVQRAMPGSGHRIFLISREKQAADMETFTVLGAKADVYKTIIGRHPSCTCMDARIRTNQCCKHHMFVMLRVLGLRPDDPRVWQRALTQAEAEEARACFFSICRQALGGAEQLLSGVLADDAVRAAYLARTGQPAGKLKAAAGPAKQKSLDSDACPICFDELTTGEAVVWCSTCGSNVHEQCFGKWVEQRRKAGAHPACVFCRSAWAVNKPPPHAEKTREGRARKPSTVVNLLDVSQAHRAADLSAGALYGNRRRDEGEDFDDEDLGDYYMSDFDEEEE